MRKSEYTITRFDRIHERDRRTDRRTDTAWRHRPRLHRIARQKLTRSYTRYDFQHCVYQSSTAKQKYAEVLYEVLPQQCHNVENIAKHDNDVLYPPPPTRGMCLSLYGVHLFVTPLISYAVLEIAVVTFTFIPFKTWLAVWLSGNALASINVVALRQTRLVLG